MATQGLPGNGQSLGVAAVDIPCRVYPGMFDREYQVTVELPGHGKLVTFAPKGYVKIPGGGEVGPEGADGSVLAAIVEDIEGADDLVVQLPGDAMPSGSRVRVPKRLVAATG